MENKYVSKFISELYLESEFADFEFEFAVGEGTVKVPVHKVILAKASRVFKAMFLGALKEKKDIVKIIDFDVGAFKEFLQFFYLPEVKLTMENVESVIRLADKYDMQDCLNICYDFLKTEIVYGNEFWCYQLVLLFEIDDLLELCEREIKLSTGDDFKSEQFLRCSRDVLENILRFDTMLCSEVELFDACIAWAKRSCHSKLELCENNPQHLKAVLGECFHLIRFPAMKNDEIENILANDIHGRLFNRKEVVDRLHSKMDENSASNMFIATPRLKSTLNWNDEKIFRWSSFPSVALECSIERQTSIWFTANARVLLGGHIRLKGIWGSFGRVGNWSISVLEYMEQSFDPDVPRKILFNEQIPMSSLDSIDLPRYLVSLPKPILIHKKRMYEIRLEASCDVSGCKSWPTAMNQTKINKKVTIKFKSSSADESRNLGLISGLQFNEIQW